MTPRINKLYKFRNWCLLSKKMVYEPYLKHVIDTPLNEIFSNEYTIYMRSHFVKDKKDKELYEGDIIKTFGPDGQPTNGGLPITICEVNYYTNPEWFEIIGNEFENPELVQYRERP